MKLGEYAAMRAAGLRKLAQRFAEMADQDEELWTWLRILVVLEEADRPMHPVEIARVTGFDVATVERLPVVSGEHVEVDDQGRFRFAWRPS